MPAQRLAFGSMFAALPGPGPGAWAGSALPRRAAPRAGQRSGACALGLAVLALLVPAGGMASPDARIAGECERWAAIAAAEFGVPEQLLRAITRVETGRSGGAGPHDIRPWPWAVNAGGQGHWFATAQEAAAFVRAALVQGEEQVDIGCFQLNVRWHGRAFASPEAMMEPSRNARYAARFLARLHAEFGNWTDAAAAYHSRTPEHGRAYVARLDAALGEMGGPAPAEAARPAAPLVSRAPELAQARAGRPAAPGGVALGGLTGAAPFDTIIRGR